jgi:hypothetical protein
MKFPSIFFLDAELFQQGKVTIPKAALAVPADVLDILGDAAEVQRVVAVYFDTIHIWFPIVSKMRLQQTMMNPLMEHGADLTLLFLCMKLITTRPPPGIESPQTPLYACAKGFLNLAESGGLVGLQVLQAAILIALYEIGHSIYPAAYLSVGHCARLGYALGVHNADAKVPMLSRPSTWTESEERRRVWWAVLILDR